MEAVNSLDRQQEINHNQKHITDSGNCHSNWASKDSGNGSEDKNDVEILQNGGTDTHSSSENGLSGDGKMKHKHNTSSSSVACNGIEPEMMSDTRSSSNCSGSSSWVKPAVTRIERQDCIDIPLPQENIDNFLQTPSVISSCQNGSSDTQGFSIHSTDTFESTPEGIPSHENANAKYHDIKVNHSHLTGGDSQDINMNHSHLAIKESQNINMNHSHLAIKESQNININYSRVVDSQETKVNHSHVVDSQDLMVNHSHMVAGQVIKVNDSHLAIKESQNNVNHSHVVDSQDINVKHSHLALKDSQDIIMNHPHMPVEEGIIMNHPHVPEEDNDNESIQLLSHQSHSGASSSELLNKCYEDSNISYARLHHDHIPRCLSVPSSSANMSHQPPQFMSLPVLPVDLVPKHIMDSLRRELHRERCKVNMLQEENNLLIKKVTELGGKYMQCKELFHHCVNELESQKQNVSSCKKNADYWQRKCNAKDKELSTAHQHLNDISERCKQLEYQIIILKTDLHKEESKNKTLNDGIYNVNQILKQERDRYNRDEKCSKERFDELKKANEWLQEELAAHIDYPMSLTQNHRSVPRRSHTEIEPDDSQSHETQRKVVYPENTVCQEIVTLPKQKPKKCDYTTQESCDTSPKVKCAEASSQNNNLPNVEKCEHCYKLASEFKSNKEFRHHIDKCGQ